MRTFAVVAGPKQKQDAVACASQNNNVMIEFSVSDHNLKAKDF